MTTVGMCNLIYYLIITLTGFSKISNIHFAVEGGGAK